MISSSDLRMRSGVGMILKHFRNAAWRAPLFLEHFTEKRHVRTRVAARLVHILQAQEIGLGFGAATELEKGQRYTKFNAYDTPR